MTVAVFGTVRLVPALIRRLGGKPVIAAGAALVTVAMLWLAQLSVTSGYLTAILGPLVLAGVGVGFATVALAATILSGVPAQDTGAASGLLQIMQWIGGGSLGLAILVAVQTSATKGAAPQAPQALTHGIATAFGAGTAFTACAVILSLLMIKKVNQPRDEPVDPLATAEATMPSADHGRACP